MAGCECCDNFSMIDGGDEFKAFPGLKGDDGTTFYPHVSAEGVLSWTNDGGKQNPDPVNIKGADGKSAYQAAVEAGFSGTEAEFNEYLSGIGVLTEEVTQQKSAFDKNASLLYSLPYSPVKSAAYTPVDFSLGSSGMAAATGKNNSGTAWAERRVMSTFLPAIAGMRVHFSGDDSYYQWLIWGFTAEDQNTGVENITGNYIFPTDDFVVPANAEYKFIRIALRRKPISDSGSGSSNEYVLVEEDETAIQAGVKIEMPISGAGLIPAYWWKHICDKLLAINILSNSTDNDYGDDKTEFSALCGDEFIFITDPHWQGNDGLNNEGHSIPIAKFIFDNTNARMVVNNGDTYNRSDSPFVAKQYIRDYHDALKKIGAPIYSVIGNHEYNNPGSSSALMDSTLTAKQVWGILNKEIEPNLVSMSRYGDFVMDNVPQKIRYICLAATFRASLAIEQRKFAAQHMMDAPDGYTIVILSHGFLSYTNGAFVVASAYQAIVNCIDALVTTTGSKIATVGGVSYDFTNTNATVACVLSGHIHRDGSILTAEGVPIIATTTDNWHKEQLRPTDRSAGNTTEQAFEYVRVDTVQRKVNLVRIGYGTDREFDYPQGNI